MAEAGGDVHVRVSDKGTGFDPARAERRGLAIIDALMDEVRIDSGPRGTMVSMVKHGGPES